ncbi:hypothetical protein ACWCY6_31240 [Streptomyces sp. 900105755]
MGSYRVIVRLRVHRYFCDRKSCSRKTFVEQVPGLSERHRRSSTGLTGWLRSIAIEFGGRPAARLRRLRLASGRTRLLRLLAAPAVPDRAPRVPGVDESAFRFTEAQGQVSGTRPFLEIQARGYRGSRQAVRKHLAALRAGTSEPLRADIPSLRKITSWIMRPRETLTSSQDERLLQVRLACPDITAATHARLRR